MWYVARTHRVYGCAGGCVRGGRGGCGAWVHVCEVGGRVCVEAAEVFVDEDEVPMVGSGNNIRVILRGIDEQDVVY